MVRQQRLLNCLANRIARDLWLADDLIVREVRTADSLQDARKRLVAIADDVESALRIVASSRPRSHR